MDMNGIVGDFLGYKIILSESCCEYVQARRHKKKRINKKWLKRYGMKLVPYNGVVVANLYGDSVILCHPKYWEKHRDKFLIGLECIV